MLYYLSEDIRIRYVSFYLNFIINDRRLRGYKYYNTLEIIRKDIINKGDQRSNFNNNRVRRIDYHINKSSNNIV